MSTHQPHKKRKLNNTKSLFNIEQFAIHEAAEGDTEDEEYDSEIDNNINYTMFENIKQQSEASYKKRKYKNINHFIPRHKNPSNHSINNILDQIKQPIYNQNNNSNKNTTNINTNSQIPISHSLTPPPIINTISKQYIKPILPSVKDPNLWLLPCKKGTEEFSAQKILENTHKYEYNLQKKLFISDAFTIDINNGYIYVQADKKVHVELACGDIQCLKPNKIKLVPLHEKLAVFKMRDSQYINENMNNYNASKPLTQPIKYTFFTGEKVKVINGSFINLKGIIISVKDNNNIIMKPNDIRLDNQILNSNELIKLIDIGSFVRVIEGKYKNMTGNVIEICKENVLICNEKQSNNMRVHINNFTEIEQVKTCDFNLYDFVYFGVNECGIIVNIKYNKFEILDIKEQIHYCYGCDIVKKGMKNMVAFDGNNNKICIGDYVRPYIGNFKNRNVIVKCIYNNILFCYSKLCHINGGIFVIKAKYCSICGGKSNQFVFKNKWKRNKWISKQVTITRGFYKGMIGIVCGVNDKTLHIELNCKNKKVKVGYDYVKMVNGYEKRNGKFDTPIYNIAATPVYENDNNTNNVWDPCFNFKM